MLVRFEGIPRHSETECHRDMKLYAESVFGGKDFYDFEFVGLHVVHNGADTDEVTPIVHAPAYHLLEITLDASDQEVLTPLVEEVVLEMDLENSTVTTMPPGGLLEL